MRRPLAVLAVVATLGMIATARQQAPPLFRSRTDIVLVDVHVMDATGRPVAGLRPEDFVVSVDGKPRDVSTVDFVSYIDAAGRPGDSGRPAPPEPVVSTNLIPETGTPPRTIFLVIDEDNIRAGAGRMAASAAERFLSSLQPDDRVGFLTIPYGRQGIDPTTDRNAVKKALQSVAGHLTDVEASNGQNFTLGMSEAFAMLHAPSRWEKDIVSRECSKPGAPGPPSLCRTALEAFARTMISDAHQRAGQSIRAFAGLLDGLAALPGPKTLVLLSQELPVSEYTAERRDFLSESARLTAAAAKAQASLYVLQLDAPLFDVETRFAPPSSGADADMRSYGLETVTSLTGGRRMMLSGQPGAAFDRMALEISGYYLLGIRADASDRDGRPHELRVEVKRKGIEVRARKAFAFDQPADAAGSKTAADLVRLLLRTADTAVAMPLAVTTYAVPRPAATGATGATPAEVGVLISADIDRGRTGAAEVSVGYALLDETGRNAGASLETLRLAPSAGDPQGRLCYLGMALVPPGSYTLRLAAADSARRGGSVVHRFTARPVRAGGVIFSDLVIIDPLPDQAGKPRPSVTASVSTKLTGYVEARPSPDAPALSARLELADADDAAPRAAGDMQVQRAGERVVVSGELPLAGVPPGTYAVTATVSGNGSVMARLTRAVRVVAGRGAAGGVPPISNAATAGTGRRVGGPG